MTLLQEMERMFPSLFEQIMRDAGIRLLTIKPEHRIPVIVSTSFEKGLFKDSLLHTVSRSYNIDPKDRLFAVTVKKLSTVLKATKFIGRIHIPVWVDLIRGDILAGRFTVQDDTYQPIDREQPGVYGDDDHYMTLVNLKLVSKG